MELRIQVKKLENYTDISGHTLIFEDTLKIHNGGENYIDVRSKIYCHIKESIYYYKEEKK